MEIFRDGKKIEFVATYAKKKYQDVYLDRLLDALNIGREQKGFKKLDYARLNKMLKKLGKSKRYGTRDMFIGTVLESKNPASYFWWVLKNKQ